jgi:hypothetical protein
VNWLKERIKEAIEAAARRDAPQNEQQKFDS